MVRIRKNKGKWTREEHEAFLNACVEPQTYFSYIRRCQDLLLVVTCVFRIASPPPNNNPRSRTRASTTRRRESLASPAGLTNTVP
ncbi:unnamed protein product [Ectocarpus sp. 6 AP-2014]